MATEAELWPYWRKNIETPCTLILAAFRQPARYLGGDCQIAASSDSHMTTYHAGEEFHNAVNTHAPHVRPVKPKGQPKKVPQQNAKGNQKGAATKGGKDK